MCTQCAADFQPDEAVYPEDTPAEARELPPAGYSCTICGSTDWAFAHLPGRG